jgi:hypothetical protein
VLPSLGTNGASAGLSAKASELTKQAANANAIVRCFIGIPSLPRLTRAQVARHAFLRHLHSVSANCIDGDLFQRRLRSGSPEIN